MLLAGRRNFSLPLLFVLGRDVIPPPCPKFVILPPVLPGGDHREASGRQSVELLECLLCLPVLSLLLRWALSLFHRSVGSWLMPALGKPHRLFRLLGGLLLGALLFQGIKGVDGFGEAAIGRSLIQPRGLGEVLGDLDTEFMVQPEFVRGLRVAGRRCFTEKPDRVLVILLGLVVERPFAGLVGGPVFLTRSQRVDALANAFLSGSLTEPAASHDLFGGGEAVGLGRRPVLFGQLGEPARSIESIEPQHRIAHSEEIGYGFRGGNGVAVLIAAKAFEVDLCLVIAHLCREGNQTKCLDFIRLDSRRSVEVVPPHRV